MKEKNIIESIKRININIKNNKSKAFKFNINLKKENNDKNLDMGISKETKNIEFYNQSVNKVPEILNIYKNDIKRKKSIKIVSKALEYFIDDFTDDYKRNKLGNQVYYYNEYKSIFNFEVFREIFFYHFLFFTILGPLVIILMNFKKGGYILGKNLMFFNFNKIFRNQFVQFLLLFTSIVFGIYFNFNLFNETFFYTLIQGVILRVLSIAGKYGSFDENYFKKLRRETITVDELNSKLLLFDWKIQASYLVNKQIKYSIDKNEIEENLFYISFIYTPSENYFEKSLFNKDKLKYYKNGSIEYIYFDCIEIFKYLNLKYQKSLNFNITNVISIIITIIRIIFPIFLQIFKNIINKKPIFKFLTDSSITEIVIFILSSKILIFYYYAFFSFFFQYLIDINRMKFILNQLTEMIQLKNQTLKNTMKFFPTINIFCDFSLNNWGNLRKLVNDYGSNFFLRNKVFAASVSIIWSYLFIFLILLEYLDENTKVKISLFTNSLLFEFFLIFTMLIIIIYYGASYNSLFNLHIDKLKYLIILLKNYKIYNIVFNKGIDTNLHIFKEEENYNYLFLKFDCILNDIVKNNKVNKDVILDRSIEAIENQIELLENEKNTKSISIFGIAMNYELINILVIVFIPIILQSLKEYFQMALK